FPALQSLAIALLGLALVVLPLILEMAGVVPTVVLFGPFFKGMVMGSLPILGGYLALLFLCILFCWYLASVIRKSLLGNEEEIEARYLDLLSLHREKTTAVLRGTHELKAPLAAIRSTAYTLRDGYGGPLPDKALHMVERIGTRCDHLLSLVTDVIRLGNLRSAMRVGEALHAVDLRRVLVEGVEEAGVLGRPGRVTVTLFASAEPVWVRASEEHLRTLFGNLLANSVHYSRPGGEVAVALAMEGGRAMVTVRDQGIGIPASALPRIFDEHYRAVNAVRHHDGGTGLGLPIVRAIANLLGAQLDVESEIDRGTLFTVTFLPMES
ncbi:MAG: HAMP domain-containing histidine kinase, partial [Desulfobulbaceae bacterium]|nr:HAMP domain-containing histidine kinase [Desulfobulbaceae bacterium]